MKNLTDLYNNSKENDSQKIVFCESGDISVKFNRPIKTTKYPEVHYSDEREGYNTKVEIPMRDGTNLVQYIPNADTSVFAVVYSENNTFTVYSTANVASQKQCTRNEYQIIEVPFGKLNSLESYLNSYILGRFDSYCYAANDFINNDFKVEVIKAEELDNKEYQDFSILGFGIEFERGVGFHKTNKDNFFVGTFWFETKKERDEEIVLCSNFYNQYKKEVAISREDSKDIWDKIFTNGLTYDLV